jgi:anaerobic ribonucleoside-triphosphate reductase activating protein
MGYPLIDGVSGSGDILNVAAVCPSARTLGPGLRGVVWVQGCIFNCRGCIAPDWIEIRPARLVSPAKIVDELLANPQVTGLTFSGGEPLLQAAALTQLAILAREKRDIDIICFSGFTREYLEKSSLRNNALALFAQIDVLIDGRYFDHLNDNIGMRGSSNQRIHYLTNRLKNAGLETISRNAEIKIADGNALMVGVPPRKIGDAFNQAIDKANRYNRRLLYERT